ncbi:Ubiquinone biosynthesis O-methyltransferase, mitochondrial [Candida viswanathii]|uniref:Ubiquinone biosynthesis O-methyltransferase, mitochondrial n=1 Tax=Candida viswanathii TaxID=5486 RepID=A0A367XYD9_9ASCO|nr:Ubiquinone biosynthesis O-methyltransferase, mitochondrial [Candida viswanathii]
MKPQPCLSIARQLTLRRLLHHSRVLLHDTKKFTSTSESEMSHFNALASSWWDVNGPQRILHKMNLLRMDFIHDTIMDNLKLNENTDDEVYIPPFNMDLLPKQIKDTINADLEGRRDEILSEANYKVLDVGCGGGILSESMARLSFVEQVKGIDLSSDVLEAAKLHKQKDPILEDKLSYSLMAIEDLPEMKSLTLSPCLRCWNTSTIHRESCARNSACGTHTLEKYINQTEIKEWLEEESGLRESFKVVDTKGCIYLPAYGWKFTSCADVGNYFMAIQRVK